MDLAAVFLLSLLGGYYFASLWRLTAYSTRKVDGHHLYFRAAFCGAVFFGLALLLQFLALTYIPAYTRLDAALREYVEPALKAETGLTQDGQVRRAEWLISAAYSLALGPVFALLLNVFTPSLWALKRSLGALNRLLLEAQQQDMPVQLTLNTGKVYVGILVSITDPDREPDIVTILPMLSGYRDPQGRLVPTTDYNRVYAGLNAGEARTLGLPEDWISQFELGIRADTIVTATLFSPAVYAKFNPDWEQQIARQNQKPAPQELLVEIQRPAKQAAPIADPKT